MEDNKIIFWSIIKGLEEVAPPLPAAKFIPQWWKNAPTYEPGTEVFVQGKQLSLNKSGTVKQCPAIAEWFTQGYVIPLWFDHLLEFKENGEWSCETPLNPPAGTAAVMNNDAFVTWLPETAKGNCVAIMKLNCPWRIKTPPGYSVYQFPMWYHFNPDFEVPPGPMWSDIYHSLAPQLMIKHYGKFLLKQGTPLCVIVPYKREPNDKFHYEIIERNKECIDLETKAEVQIHGVFEGGYKKLQREIDEEKKCPVHHK